jgi:hypothetical protein
VLFISQFVPSTLRWAAVGLEIDMQAQLELGSTQSVTPRAAEAQRLREHAMGQLDASLLVSLTIGGASVGGGTEGTGDPASLPAGRPSAADVELRVRVPGWAVAGSMLVLRRGAHISGPPDLPVPLQNGTWCVVPAPAGGWRKGDVVNATLRMAPRLERINDVRDAYGV